MQIRDVLRSRRAARPFADPATRPSGVNTAWWLYVATAVSSLLLNGAGLVLNGRSFGQVESDARANGTSAGEAHADVVLTLVIIAVVTVAFSALLVLFARGMRRGYPRSRVVVTVLGAIALLNIVGFGIGSLTALLALFAIFFTYLPTTNDWFRSVARPRPY